MIMKPVTSETLRSCIKMLESLPHSTARQLPKAWSIFSLPRHHDNMGRVNHRFQMDANPHACARFRMEE